MIYVTADLHGRADRFDEVLTAARFSDSDELYILGDVVDRNPDGIALLQRIRDTRNMHLLLGNHEHMMLEALGDPFARVSERFLAQERWYYNGGEITRQALDRLEEGEREALLAYVRALPLNIPLTLDGRRYLLVHGSPASLYRPRASHYPDETSFAVWKRFDPGADRVERGVTVIGGHTPTVHYSGITPMEIFRSGQYWCIDCGCAYPASTGGRLALLRLDDERVWYSK